MEIKEISEEQVSGLKTARWITKEQLDSIEELVSQSGGRAVTRPHTGDDPYGPTIYELGNEPLMVFNKVSKNNPKHVGWVFPSEKHAKVLQEAGIMNYSNLEGSKDA